MPCFLSDRGGVGRDSWGCRRCSCRAFGGPFGSSSRRLSRTVEGSCSRCMGSWQVRAGTRGLTGRPWGLGSPYNKLSLPGLRARMVSLRQGCGDLRGLVSTFTQSCQCSLSEARGQVRTICPLSRTCSLGSPVTVLPWGTLILSSHPGELPAEMKVVGSGVRTACDLTYPGCDLISGSHFCLCKLG